MEQDSTNQPNLSEQEQELNQLQHRLDEAVAAERFFETASGRLIVELINRRVNISLKKITSDGFLKDHTGYVNEVQWLRANQRLLKELQAGASPHYRNKLLEKMEAYEDGE